MRGGIFNRQTAVGAELTGGATTGHFGVVGALDEPPNPAFIFSVPALHFFPLLYEHLIAMDPEEPAGRPPVPELAASYELAGDGTTLVFTVREGARWHDGRPVTAADVVFSVTYQRDHLHLVDAWVVSTGPGEKERAAVQLPTASYLELRMLANLFMLPEHVWSALGAPYADPAVTDPSLIGSGPFRLVERQAAGGFLLERVVP